MLNINGIIILSLISFSAGSTIGVFLKSPIVCGIPDRFSLAFNSVISMNSKISVYKVCLISISHTVSDEAKTNITSEY